MKTLEIRQVGRQFLRQFARRRGGFAALAISGLVAACLVAAPSASLAAQGDCSQPSSTGVEPIASDCIYVLKSAIGLVPCTLCVCDVNGSTSLSAGDALVCLKHAVGQNVTLQCPACTPTTTTTTTTKAQGSTSSTTTSSTSSTTSTLPVACESNSACTSLGSPFRCNPFTGKCEKPCNGTKDCKDFYECNPDKYCVPPLSLF